MFELNECLKKLDTEGSPIRTSLVGAGSMGGELTAQINKAPGMEIDIVVDLKIENALRAFRRAGIDNNRIVVCNSITETEKALGSGKKVCSSKLEVAWGIKTIDVVVEATGVPDAYANIVLNAIKNKKHIVTLNVEGDVCIGHIMKMFADNAGVVYTGIYGDEPGSAMLLYYEAASLGFDIVGMGRSDMGGSNIEWNKETVKKVLLQNSDMKEFQQNTAMFASFCDGSKTNEECCMMANATGLRPDIRGMHGPYVSFENFPIEVPRLLQLKKDGGILSNTGVVEFIKPPGDSPLPTSPNFIWVFVVVRATTPFEKHIMFDSKSENRILYTCYHLVSVQAPITIAEAMIDHRAVVAPKGNKRAADVITMAKKDLEVGEIIDEIGGLCAAGRIEVASITRNENLLPFALAARGKVKNPIPKGEYLTYDDVEIRDNQSLILQLRRLQDRLFGDLH